MSKSTNLLRYFASISLCGLTSGPLVAQTRDGAVLGGVAGAVIGGIVGHQNDETPEGALIGGAVGAIAGGMRETTGANNARSATTSNRLDSLIRRMFTIIKPRSIRRMSIQRPSILAPFSNDSSPTTGVRLGCDCIGSERSQRDGHRQSYPHQWCHESPRRWMMC